MPVLRESEEVMNKKQVQDRIAMTPDMFANEARMLMSFIAQSVGKKHDQEIAERLLARTFLAGMRRFAWWKDGTEMVGTCGTTFDKACQEVMTEAGLKRGV